MLGFFVRQLVVLIALAVPMQLHAQTLPENTSGVGAHPLSDAVAATWFVESKTEAGKRLAAIIFLVGKPGWTAEPTDWDWHMGDPMTSYFKVAGSELRVEYYPSSGRLVVLAHDAPVSSANVVVVRGIGEGALRITYLEHAPLDFAPSANPSVELVQRSPALRAELLKP